MILGGSAERVARPGVLALTASADVGDDMTSTAVLTEDSATIVAEEGSRFSWGITLAGAAAAMATSFFLLTLGAGVGLGFLALPASTLGATTFLTLGAIYFLASQAFGFAVGGYLVGRLMGPDAENSREEEFRASAHGFAMWAVAVLATMILAGSVLAGSALAVGVNRADKAEASHSYWVDQMFSPSRYSAQVAADKAEAGRILAMNVAMSRAPDDERLARLIGRDAGLSLPAAQARVRNVQAEMRLAADKARKAASILALWTALALLFGAVVSVAAAISARWMDDRISFSFAPRRPRGS
jgi:hypothetical protein